MQRLAIAAAILWLGRRDLTHPAVAFGLAWFLSVAITQLDLTSFVQPWSGSFALLVFGGGLAFVAAAVISAGTDRARGTVARSDPTTSRGASCWRRWSCWQAACWAAGWRAAFSAACRCSRGTSTRCGPGAYGNGNVAIPSYVTFLSNGFYLGGWCLLAYLWLRWRELSSLAIAAIAAGGVRPRSARSPAARATSSSTRSAVPLVAVYASTHGCLDGRSDHRGRRCPAPGRLQRRLHRPLGGQRGTDQYLDFELSRQPRMLRPLVPLYVATAYPFEAERRYVLAMPGKFSPTRGGATLASLPDAAFPHGKPPLGNMIGTLTHTSPKAPNWTVASYQGRIIADFGATAVLPFSILLGLLLGAGYRACRGRRGLLALAAVGIIAYYAAFMTYDNLLSFSLGVFYDLAVVACVAAFAGGLTVRGRLRRPGSAGVRTVAP